VPNPGRLTNLSVLTSLDPSDTFTFGYVVGGAGTAGNKPILMRAGGPSLTAFGLTSSQVLPDPVMQFYNGATLVSQNAGWGGDSSILATAASVGAYAYASATSKDSAIYISAVPSGNNTFIVKGNTAISTGQVLAEVYDATPSSQFNASTPRLVNVSVRKNVGQLITAGFALHWFNQRPCFDPRHRAWTDPVRRHRSHRRSEDDALQRQHCDRQQR
jgi:hypothetical protein